MELDDMKKLWQAQHSQDAAQDGEGEHLAAQFKKGEKGLSIAYPGEHDAEFTALDKSAGYIPTLLKNEYTGLSLVVLITVSHLYFTERAFISNTAMVGFLTLLLFFVAKIGFMVYRIRLLKRIDLAADTISDAALKMDRFQLSVTRDYQIGAFLVPLAFISHFLFFYGYKLPELIGIMPGLVLLSVLLIVLGYFMQKSSYSNKIKAIKAHIRDVKDFQDSM